MSAHRARKLVEAGVWLRMSGDQEGARKLFEHALNLDPSNERARQLLEAPTAPPGQTLPAYAAPPTDTGQAPASNPFVPAMTPSRSVGLEVDWGLAAILPESQAALRPGAPPPPPPPPEPVAQERVLAPPRNAWESIRSLTGPEVIPIEPGPGHAMDLLSGDTAPPSGLPDREDSAAEGSQESRVQSLVQGATDLMGLDDHTGAMDLILQAQRIAPDHPDVRQLRERSERTLLNMYESKLGPLAAVPRVLLKQDEVIWLNLDHRAGFVLAQIDGAINFEDLFAVSGMSRLDTARILAQLKDQGVIAVA